MEKCDICPGSLHHSDPKGTKQPPNKNTTRTGGVWVAMALHVLHLSGSFMLHDSRTTCGAHTRLGNLGCSDSCCWETLMVCAMLGQDANAYHGSCGTIRCFIWSSLCKFVTPILDQPRTLPMRRGTPQQTSVCILYAPIPRPTSLNHVGYTVSWA
ncbi:hypothetical protein BDW62DRAFT_163112 [Aspergillus aurantiobrunneus]